MIGKKKLCLLFCLIGLGHGQLAAQESDSWLDKVKKAGEKVADVSKDTWESTAEFSQDAWQTTKNWTSAAWDKSVEWIEQGEQKIAEMVEPETPDEAKYAINAMSDVALAKLFKKNAKAKRIFDKAYGYAVFDSRKFSLLIHTNGGSGVAVDKRSGKRVYMNMFGAGLALGLGGKFYQQIMMFETKEKFLAFTANDWDKGWEGSSEAGAVIMDESAELGLKFNDGLAVFVLNEAGLLVDANLTGSKYWLDSDLNTP